MRVNLMDSDCSKFFDKIEIYFTIKQSIYNPNNNHVEKYDIVVHAGGTES